MSNEGTRAQLQQLIERSYKEMTDPLPSDAQKKKILAEKRQQAKQKARSKYGL